jgi:two-component system LytT family response regulator
MKTRAILVDDEPLARARMRDLLGAHPDIEVIAECDTAAQARAASERDAPDLLFLDVQMPRMSGLELVQLLGEAELPLVVFVTGHESFAVEAFDTRAVDYLLKPVRPERLARALDRVRAQLAAIREAPAEPALPDPRPISRLMVKAGDRVIFIPREQIDWIESAGNYVILHAGGERHIIRETMSTLERGLPATEFVRLNRSLLVSISRVIELKLNAQGGYYALLQGGTKANITVGLRELEQRLRFS